MSDGLELTQAPELVFGLVAPIGVDLDLVSEVLGQTLLEMDYEARSVRLTTLMKEVPIGLEIADTPYIKSYKDRIAYANEVRAKLGDASLAALAISAIRAYRAEEWKRRLTPAEFVAASVGENPLEETPLPGQAYIIRQFKRPEEISVLRSVYGRQFVLLAAYAPKDFRQRRIEDREKRSRAGLISDMEAHNLAFELVVQDANEAQHKHGQNLRDAFALGDVFIDATSRATCENTLKRFIRLLFGNNEIAPTRDEYGMYLAKSASLRSLDLSRQVGAAIFRKSGEVITLGCNEVPKAGGGTYWSGDPGDRRDFVEGYDPNDQRRFEVLVDVIDRLREGNHLSKKLSKMSDAEEIARSLLADGADGGLSESKIMDILEFGRIIHAEMSAICDAARKGVSVEGSTLYCTTFPCHICAKHIVGSGILRVVYLEPYPKSYAHALHSDSIDVEVSGDTGKVHFESFVGVSPYRYRDLFEKGKRKYLGTAQQWNKGARRPMIEVYSPMYFTAEALVLASVKEKLDELSPGHNVISLPDASRSSGA